MDVLKRLDELLINMCLVQDELGELRKSMNHHNVSDYDYGLMYEKEFSLSMKKCSIYDNAMFIIDNLKKDQTNKFVVNRYIKEFDKVVDVNFIPNHK